MEVTFLPSFAKTEKVATKLGATLLLNFWGTKTCTLLQRQLIHQLISLLLCHFVSQREKNYSLLRTNSNEKNKNTWIENIFVTKQDVKYELCAGRKERGTGFVLRKLHKIRLSYVWQYWDRSKCTFPPPTRFSCSGTKHEMNQPFKAEVFVG